MEKRKLLSKIIRYTKSAPTIYIGEKHLDFENETLAEDRMSEILPLVSVTTDADGSKYIPIAEVSKIEKRITDEREKAFHQGNTEGHQRGLSEGLKEAEKVLQNLNKAINDSITQREALFEESKEKILELVIQISKKVTYGAITIDPEKTLDIIVGVIDTLIDRSNLKIKVNPDHLPIVEQNIDKFLRGSATIKEIKIEPDPRVKYGGCFIETPVGDIDARLDSQFAVIEDVLSSKEDEL